MDELKNYTDHEFILDETLRAIIFGDMPEHFMSDSMLAKPEQIKQVFIKAGWLAPDHDPLRQIEVELKRLSERVKRGL